MNSRVPGYPGYWVSSCMLGPGFLGYPGPWVPPGTNVPGYRLSAADPNRGNRLSWLLHVTNFAGGAPYPGTRVGLRKVHSSRVIPGNFWPIQGGSHPA
eukprot:3044640-Rhodomonas_salina.1